MIMSPLEAGVIYVVGVFVTAYAVGRWGKCDERVLVGILGVVWPLVAIAAVLCSPVILVAGVSDMLGRLFWRKPPHIVAWEADRAAEKAARNTAPPFEYRR